MRKNMQDLKAMCISSEYKPGCPDIKQQGESRSRSTPLQRTTPWATSSDSKNVVDSSVGSSHHLIHVSNAACGKNRRAKNKTKNSLAM